MSKPLSILHSSFDILHSASSSIHLTQHDIDRPDERDQIRDEVSLRERGEGLEVDERWRTDAEAVGALRLAVADDVVPELPFRRLDRVIDLAFRRADDAGDLRLDVAGGSLFDQRDALSEDVVRLPHLFHAH